MKDPNSVAFEIRNPFIKADKQHYRPSLLTIWHHDPSNYNSNVKCAWFIRSHHMDKVLIDKIKKDFAFEWKYWFTEDGLPKLDKHSLALNMYQKAVWSTLLHEYPRQYNKASRMMDRFFRKHLYEILLFADNPVDCLFPSHKITYEKEQAEHFAEIIAADIARKRRPWYKHPRWHIHHWRFQFHPFQQLKRRLWTKCSICGKRGSKTSFMSDWDGTKRWHQECDSSRKAPIATH